MNRHYLAFIDLGRTLAADKKLIWDILVNENGDAIDGIGWNLTACVGGISSHTFYLRDFGQEPKALKFIHTEQDKNGLVPIWRKALSPAWQDLIKAAVSEQLFVKRNSTAYVFNNIARPLRVLATCATKEPWELTLDELQRAIRIGTAIQKSGKLGDNIKGLIKIILDAYHICDVGQMYSMLNVGRLAVSHVKSRQTMSEDELRDKLDERKRAERLPTRQAFWELIRIVMTEHPKSFVDELRFSAVKVMILTGLRSGEAALLPLDWLRQRTFLDRRGIEAGKAGGFTTSLMLRYFAEKQQEEESNSRILNESAQPIPEMFRKILTETLDRVTTITRPLRETLKLQCESGRLLPWYQRHEIVPVVQLYTHISGNPFWLDIERESFTNEYREHFDPEVLFRLQRFQLGKYCQSTENLAGVVYTFCNRLRKQMTNGQTPLVFRAGDGSAIKSDDKKSWRETYLHIGEFEDYLRNTKQTKISDTLALPVGTATIQPWELMFLYPKRSVVEERDDGICDITRYFAIGLSDSRLIGIALGDSKTKPSLFTQYGATEHDKKLSMESHKLRHLQNTELFRLGVADTIISKRYNRRSVAQSYEYDHRSLAEELEQISIPEEIELMLGEKATTVAKMIRSGKATGPVVDAFFRIQKKEGDFAAYEYLKVEADGFHATPYGHCLNSFTVDPCPKHLECFANCRHLSATNLPENRQNLIQLERKFVEVIEKIQSRPSTSIGWKNQLDHAKERLAGVQKLLSVKPGERPFPNGVDLSASQKTSIFDKE